MRRVKVRVLEVVPRYGTSITAVEVEPVLDNSYQSDVSLNWIKYPSTSVGTMGLEKVKEVLAFVAVTVPVVTSAVVWTMESLTSQFHDLLAARAL